MIDPAVLEILRRSSELALDREGNWTHQGVPIGNPKIVALFNRGLDVSESGEPILRVGQQWCYLDVEDTLYIVRDLRRRGDTLIARLNDESEGPLDLDSFSYRDLQTVYCQVKDGQRARLSRHAMAALAEVLDREDDGTFVLRVGTGRHLLRDERVEREGP